MKINKVLFIIAGAAVLLGAAIAGVAILLGAGRSDPGELQTQTVPAVISKINIAAGADDIYIIPAETDEIKLTYTTGRTKQYDFRADGDMLSLTAVPRSWLDIKWYDYISFNFNGNRNKIEVTVPIGLTADFTLASDYGGIYAADLRGSMRIASDCGKVELEKSEFSKLECEIDYGDLTLKNVSAGNIKIDSDCGGVSLADVSGNVSAACDCGSISIERLTGGSITLECDAGDISLTDVSGNVTAHCDYGSISMDKLAGRNIMLESDCGSINGTILGSEEDYTINAETDVGDKNIRNRSGGRYTLDVNVDVGDIDIRFLG